MTNRVTRRASGQDPHQDACQADLLRQAWQDYFAMRDRMRAGEPGAEERALVLCMEARKLYRAGQGRGS